MADDWKAGDYALCISSLHDCTPPLVAGTIYRVDHVFFGIDQNGETGVALALVGIPTIVASDGCQYDGHDVWHFIKAHPHAPDEFDRETIDLMNGAPVGEPVA